MVETHDAYLVNQNHQVNPEQKETDITLAKLDVRINILCDQIIYNPSDETVTMTACHLQRSSYNSRGPLIHYSSKISSNLNKTKLTKYKVRYIPIWPSHADVGDVICLGSTVIIIMLLLSVFILYLSKDHENQK